MSWFRPDASNARRHPERAVEVLRASLERFGQQKPIVAMRDGTIIAGNSTHAVAVALGWTHLAAVVFDKADAASAAAYALADNRAPELSVWNLPALKDAVGTLKAWDEAAAGWFGFDDAEVRELFGVDWDDDGGDTEKRHGQHAGERITLTLVDNTLRAELLKTLDDTIARKGWTDRVLILKR